MPPHLFGLTFTQSGASIRFSLARAAADADIEESARLVLQTLAYLASAQPA